MPQASWPPSRIWRSSTSTKQQKKSNSRLNSKNQSCLRDTCETSWSTWSSWAEASSRCGKSTESTSSTKWKSQSSRFSTWQNSTSTWSTSESSKIRTQWTLCLKKTNSNEKYQSMLHVDSTYSKYWSSSDSTALAMSRIASTATWTSCLGRSRLTARASRQTKTTSRSSSQIHISTSWCCISANSCRSYASITNIILSSTQLKLTTYRLATKKNRSCY